MQALDSRTVVTRGPDTWWGDLDESVLAALGDGGKSARELADALGISEASTASLLSMLAIDGRIRIVRVERVAV